MGLWMGDMGYEKGKLKDAMPMLQFVEKMCNNVRPKA